MKNFTDKKPELNVPRYPENLMKTVEKEVLMNVLFGVIFYCFKYKSWFIFSLSPF
jgi:hypothetical protein